MTAPPAAVRLLPIADDDLLERLLDVAVAQASPDEVMPPVVGPPGWTERRVAAFRAFHRERYPGLAGPQRTVMFAVVTDAKTDAKTDGEVVGMIRMTRCADAGIVQTGLWLGTAARGRGIGTAALRALLVEAAAAGAHTVVADTTAGNLPALRMLRRCGADLAPHEETGARVDAVLRVERR